MLGAWALAGMGLTLGGGPRSVPRATLPRFDTTLSYQRFNYPERYESGANEWGYDPGGGSLAVGYGWSDHLRTEIEVSATSAAYTQGHYDVGGTHPAFVAHEHRHQQLSLIQWVQFRRNAWVQPLVGVGLAADRDQRESRLDSPPPELLDGREYATRAERERALALNPSRTAVTLQPFVAGALKVYVSRRLFVRAGFSAPFGGGGGSWRLFLGGGGDW